MLICKYILNINLQEIVLSLKPVSHICELKVQPHSDLTKLEIAVVAVRSKRKSVWSVTMLLRSLRLRKPSVRVAVAELLLRFFGTCSKK